MAFAHESHAQERRAPTIALGGDVLYDGPLAFQLRMRGREVGRSGAYREVFADLAPALSSADLAVVNLEVPVSPRYREREEIEGSSPVFRAPEDFLDALREAGVDGLTVANNHAFDQGVAGLGNTVRAIEEHDLVSFGAGDTLDDAGRAVIVPVGGARVAIAAWTEGSNHRPSIQEGTSPTIALVRSESLVTSLRAARREAHFVIASFHWTQEGEVDPRPWMRHVAREAAEAGADLVYGHGTHLPGRTETIVTSDGRRVPVLYSLGNLLAAMEEPAGTLASREVGVRDAPIAVISTRWEGERLVAADVGMRHHFLARPTETPDSVSGVFRPVAIERALETLGSQPGCRECEHMLGLYRRRDRLMRSAMRPLATPPILWRPAESEDPAAPVARREPSRPAELAGSDAPRRRPAEPRAASATPPPAVAEPRIPDDDRRLAPLLRGVELAIEFRDGSMVERTVDAAAIARIADLMREDRSLRVLTIAYGEHALLRARRVNGLIAVRGPSRSRFTAREAPGAPRVVVRLYR
jgi:hypothetical protein